MKIAVASSGLGHVARGVETWALALAEGLAREGEDVFLFGNGRGSADGNIHHEEEEGERKGEEDDVQCSTHSTILMFLGLGSARRSDCLIKGLAKWMPGFTWRFGWKSAYGWEQFMFWLKLWPYLRKEKIDILHLQDPVVAWWCEKFYSMGLVKTKVILVNGTEESMEFLSKRCYVQELSPEYFKRHLGLPAGFKRYCIPNFVNIHKFKPLDKMECRKKLGLPDDVFLVLSVGAIGSENKRMSFLIDEFQSVAKENAVLLLVGADDDNGKLVALEGKEKLGDRLVVMSDVACDDMPVVYGAADLFVLCALKEIFGIAFLEAMACGIPCVGHTNPVTEWIIGDGGWCVDMEREAPVAPMMDDGRRMAEEKGVGRERVEKMFSWEAVYPMFMEMYRDVMR